MVVSPANLSVFGKTPLLIAPLWGEKNGGILIIGLLFSTMEKKTYDPVCGETRSVVVGSDLK